MNAPNTTGGTQQAPAANPKTVDVVVTMTITYKASQKTTLEEFTNEAKKVQTAIGECRKIGKVDGFMKIGNRIVTL